MAAQLSAAAQGAISRLVSMLDPDPLCQAFEGVRYALRCRPGMPGNRRAAPAEHDNCSAVPAQLCAARGACASSTHPPDPRCARPSARRLHFSEPSQPDGEEADCTDAAWLRAAAGAALLRLLRAHDAVLPPSSYVELALLLQDPSTATRSAAVRKTRKLVQHFMVSAPSSPYCALCPHTNVARTLAPALP